MEHESTLFKTPCALLIPETLLRTFVFRNTSILFYKTKYKIKPKVVRVHNIKCDGNAVL
jgi:hypothetical protein